jgi:hypothetical protein
MRVPSCALSDAFARASAKRAVTLLCAVLVAGVALGIPWLSSVPAVAVDTAPLPPPPTEVPTLSSPTVTVPTLPPPPLEVPTLTSPTVTVPTLPPPPLEVPTLPSPIVTVPTLPPHRRSDSSSCHLAGDGLGTGFGGRLASGVWGRLVREAAGRGVGSGGRGSVTSWARIGPRIGRALPPSQSFRGHWGRVPGSHRGRFRNTCVVPDREGGRGGGGERSRGPGADRGGAVGRARAGSDLVLVGMERPVHSRSRGPWRSVALVAERRAEWQARGAPIAPSGRERQVRLPDANAVGVVAFSTVAVVPRASVGYAAARPAPKSGRSRTVALDEETVAVLKRWRTHQREERLQRGEAWTDSGYVFTREDGNPLHPQLLSDAFERRVKAANLPAIRFHDLRDAHATLLLAAGVHPKVVQERLGHSGISITLDLYSRCARDAGGCSRENRRTRVQLELLRQLLDCEKDGTARGALENPSHAGKHGAKDGAALARCSQLKLNGLEVDLKFDPILTSNLVEVAGFEGHGYLVG